MKRPALPLTGGCSRGTLDDTSWLRPVAHVFMRSAQPWEQISNVECFDTLPKDFWSFADKWQQMWNAR
jgi:hypothetical protein